MVRVRWEYREVVRTVTVIAVGEDTPTDREAARADRRRTVPAPIVRSARDHRSWARVAAPVFAVLALAVSRGVIEHRHQLGAPKRAALPAGSPTLIALPSGDRSNPAS